MKSKSLLFIGIFLLIVGILLRKTTQLDIIGLILIIIGVTCKSIYIIKKAISGEYKPGKELIVLALGLTLFFVGMFFKKNEGFDLFNPVYLMITGISLKIVFIVRFIQITRTEKKK